MNPPDASPPSAPTRSRRRWLRLSLRGLMVLVLVFAAGLGYVVHLAHVQREAVAAIRRTGGYASYGWHDLRATDAYPTGEMTYFPPWMSDYLAPEVRERVLAWLGPDYFGAVSGVTLGEGDGFGGNNIGEAEMAHVARLRRLAAFWIGSPRLGKAEIKYLAGLTDLTEIVYMGTAADSDASLADLSRLTKLRSLSLNVPTLVDADLAALRNLANLKHPSIVGPLLTDAGLAHLRGLVGLKELRIVNTPITTAGLAHLRTLRNLRSIALSSNRVADLGPLADLPGLEELELYDNPVTAAGLAPLARMGHLGTLSLRRCNVTTAGLAALSGAAGLHKVDLIWCNLSGVRLEALAKLPHLATLGLTETELTDADLATLGPAPSLRNLTLRGNDITDTGIDYLEGSTSLTYLDIFRTKVTAGRVARLRQTHPGLNIR